MTQNTKNCSTTSSFGPGERETSVGISRAPVKTGERISRAPVEATGNLEAYLEDDFMQLIEAAEEEENKFLILCTSGAKDLIAAIKAKKLQAKDLMVLLVYSYHADWRTGRCRLTVEGLAELLDQRKPTLYPSVRRLRECNLLVPARDPRTKEKYYIINPYFLKAGSGKARGLLIKAFNEAISANKPEEAEIFLEDSHSPS